MARVSELTAMGVVPGALGRRCGHRSSRKEGHRGHVPAWPPERAWRSGSSHDVQVGAAGSQGGRHARASGERLTRGYRTPTARVVCGAAVHERQITDTEWKEKKDDPRGPAARVIASSMSE